MKRHVIFFVLGAMCLFSSHAQTRYYTTSHTISRPDFTYQCDNENGLVTLYNTENQFINTDPIRKDGNPVGSDIFLGYIPCIEKDGWTARKAWEIVDATFTYEERVALKEAEFSVWMNIDSSTGKVVDVEFGFGANALVGTIPPEKFYAIEQGLKRELWFTITAAGKELNYCMAGWIHTIRPGIGPGIPLPDPDPVPIIY